MLQESLRKASSYEVTIADMAKRSERRAWRIAAGSLLMSLILAGGYFYLLPLKEKTPFLVMADAYTGTATVAQLRGDFSKNSITASDAINRSHVYHYVMARESYDLALLRLRDWKTVYTMSGPDVSAAYSALYAENNPSSPYNLYGKGKAIRVKILSVVLIGSGKGAVPKGATVRFQRSLYDKQSGGIRYLDSKLATLEFAYKPNLSMKEQDRIENPLGFQVTSYRVDNDYATPSPPQIELPSENADAANGADAEDPEKAQALNAGGTVISDQPSPEK
jgi:type IV secretion system protein VirB8